MSDGDRTDFVVHQDKLGLVIGRDGRTKARIERLFDVAMDLTSHGQPDGEWVTLCGHEDNRRKAQVISGLCEPFLLRNRNKTWVCLYLLAGVHHQFAMLPRRGDQS